VPHKSKQENILYYKIQATHRMDEKNDSSEDKTIPNDVPPDQDADERSRELTPAEANTKNDLPLPPTTTIPTLFCSYHHRRTNRNVCSSNKEVPSSQYTGRFSRTQRKMGREKVTVQCAESYDFKSCLGNLLVSTLTKKQIKKTGCTKEVLHRTAEADAHVLTCREILKKYGEMMVKASDDDEKDKSSSSTPRATVSTKAASTKRDTTSRRHSSLHFFW
jgi:hypothetical protein